MDKSQIELVFNKKFLDVDNVEKENSLISNILEKFKLRMKENVSQLEKLQHENTGKQKLFYDNLFITIEKAKKYKEILILSLEKSESNTISIAAALVKLIVT